MEFGHRGYWGPFAASVVQLNVLCGDIITGLQRIEVRNSKQ